MNSHYTDMLARFQQRWGEAFDPSGLDMRFADFYGTRTRIGVRWSNDHDEPTKFGTVGVTTGWRPCFLLIRRSSDHGSSELLDTNMDIVMVKYPGNRKYHTYVKGVTS